MEKTNMTRLLTVDQVARLTGWRPATIRMKVWKRELPYIKLGRSVRFRESEIQKLIEGSEVPALESQSR
jgi:excisionase family DNA binding protein